MLSMALIWNRCFGLIMCDYWVLQNEENKKNLIVFKAYDLRLINLDLFYRLMIAFFSWSQFYVAFFFLFFHFILNIIKVVKEWNKFSVVDRRQWFDVIVDLSWLYRFSKPCCWCYMMTIKKVIVNVFTAFFLFIILQHEFIWIPIVFQRYFFGLY